jgi:hypothetical protein
MQFFKRLPTSIGPPIFAMTSAPKCLECNREMTVTLVASMMFAKGIDQITYTCEECGTEQRRTVPSANGY